MLAALEAEGAVYVVIGGTAAAIHGARHVTFDLDITRDREIANLARVAAALRRMNAHRYGMEPDGKYVGVRGEELDRSETATGWNSTR